MRTGLLAPAGRRTPPADRFDRALIVPMVLGAVLNPVNSSIIAVSLVPISRALGAPASQTLWLVSALYLATAVGQPVVGRLVDLFGPRALSLAGSSLVALAGLIGTLAPSLGVLVVARVILGFGTCAGYPAAMYLIRAESRRTGEESPSGILATLAVSSQTVVVIGPTLGGLLVGLAGWRATFAVNVPLALASLAMSWALLPRRAELMPDGEDRPEDAPGVRSLDLSGIALFATMLTALMLGLMGGGARTAIMLALAAAVGVLFCRRELRAADPFLDLRVLGGNLPLIATYVRTLLAMTTSYAFLYGYTQWLEDGRGLSATHAGMLLLPMSLTALVLSSTIGRRPAVLSKLVVGALCQVAGCAALLVVGPHSAILGLIGIGLVFGVPQGLISLANQNAVYYQADPARIGASAGLLRTAAYLGAVLASTLTGACFGATADSAGLHEVAAFLVGASLVLLLLVLADRSLRRLGTSGTTAQPRSTT